MLLRVTGLKETGYSPAVKRFRYRKPTRHTARAMAASVVLVEKVESTKAARVERSGSVESIYVYGPLLYDSKAQPLL
jgi:hypothetical protein